MKNTISNYNKKLFIRLFGTLLLVLILISSASYFYEMEKIKSSIQEKVLNESDKLTLEFIQMHSHASMKRNENSIIKDPSFLLFSLTNNEDKQVHYEEDEKYQQIIKQLNKFEHDLTIQKNTGAKIILMHNHDNDAYYLDLKIPWDISDTEKGKVHIFYNATLEIHQAYEQWLKEVFNVIVVMILFFIAGYPTVIYLNQEILIKNKELIKTNIDILNLLGSAIAKRDSDTDAHNYRVTLYSLLLGEALELSKESLVSLIKGAFLHDVGKIGISDNILLKAGKLTNEEFEIMKKHVEYGKEIISNSKQLIDAREVVAYHHEKYDGSGYIKGLKGNEIPLNARIFAIADVFDALTSKRPYKEPFSYEKASEIMNAESGKHFDPELLNHFFEIVFPLYEQLQLSEDNFHLPKKLLEDKVLFYFS